MTTTGDPLDDRDPERIGTYRLLGRLGRGGMAAVYSARAASGELVALKLAHELRDQSDADLARLRREIRAATSVHSPHVAAVLAFDSVSVPPYVVMELIDGPTLRAHLHTRGALRPPQVRDLARSTARGLASIHAREIAHRDVTWSNVVLGPTGAVIIDLGIALVPDDTRSSGTGVFGSPGWVPPETLGSATEADTADHRRGDVFQWGLLVSHASTGRHPFAGDPDERPMDLQWAMARGREADLHGVPGGLRDLVRRALDPEPTQRPTAAWLSDELTRRFVDPGVAADGLTTRMDKVPPPEPPRDPPVGRSTTRRARPAPPTVEGLPPPSLPVLAARAPGDPEEVPWTVVPFVGTATRRSRRRQRLLVVLAMIAAVVLLVVVATILVGPDPGPAVADPRPASDDLAAAGPLVTTTDATASGPRDARGAG